MRIIMLAILALLILVPPAVFGETEKPSILVLSPKVTHRLRQEEPELAQSIADLLRVMLSKHYQFPDRATLIEAGKSTGLSSTQPLHSELDACGRFGRAAGADLVLTGQLHSFGDKIVVHFQLVDIPATGPGVPRQTVMQRCTGLDGLPELLPFVVKGLGLTTPPQERVVPARPKPAKSVEKLIEQLGYDDAGVRFSAAIELGRSGKQKAVEPLMKLAANDRDLFVRRAAARSLGELGNRKAVPALIGLLGDREFFVATTANQAIINITRHDCGLREGLTSEEVQALTEQARAWWTGQEGLVEKSPPPKPVAPAPPKAAERSVKQWIQNLSDDDAGVRFSAAVELGRSGSLEAVEALMVVATNDSDTFVRRAAARGLGELGDRKAVPALIELLADDEIFVAIVANRAIINITRHDCGFKGDLTPGGKQKLVDQARAWWKSQEK